MTYDFYNGTPPHSDGDTSKAAAHAIKPSAGTLRAQVLAAIEGAGTHGYTDGELQTTLKMTGNTQRPRRRELEEANLIHDSGKRRKTVKGRDAVVWVSGPAANPRPRSQVKRNRGPSRSELIVRVAELEDENGKLRYRVAMLENTKPKQGRLF